MIVLQCREIAYRLHEELLKVLHELHTAMRTYNSYQSEFLLAQGKLDNLRAQKTKMEHSIPKEKLEKRRKYKVIEKEIEKVVIVVFLLMRLKMYFKTAIFFEFARVGQSTCLLGKTMATVNSIDIQLVNKTT